MEPQQITQAPMAAPQPSPASPVIYKEEKAWYRQPGIGIKAIKKVTVVVTADGMFWCIDPLTNQTLWTVSLRAPNTFKVASAYFRMTEVNGEKFTSMTAKNPYMIAFFNQYYMLVSYWFMFGGVKRANALKKALKDAGLL